jgi:hypothetical protein
VPWLAIVDTHEGTKGWELAFDDGGRCEVTLRGFVANATLEDLASRLAGPGMKVRLVESDHYIPDARDAEYLADQTGLEISV